MPAHQRVHVDVDADIGVLLQVADVGLVAVRGAVDAPQFQLRHQDGAVADLRVVSMPRWKRATPATVRNSPISSSRAMLRAWMAPWPVGLWSSSSSEISPMIITGPLRIPRNLPTVACSSSPDRAVGARLTVACAPEIEMTRPMGSPSAGDEPLLKGMSAKSAPLAGESDRDGTTDAHALLTRCATAAVDGMDHAAARGPVPALSCRAMRHQDGLVA